MSVTVRPTKAAAQTANRYLPMHHNRLFLHLATEARAQGFTVRLVTQRRLKDYIGMNGHAARAMGYPMPLKCIEVLRSLPVLEKYHVLRHELIEWRLMDKGKYHYWQAHKAALRRE